MRHESSGAIANRKRPHSRVPLSVRRVGAPNRPFLATPGDG